MNTKKIFILCYDGLEYNLVLKLGLRNLLQKEHGQVKIPFVMGKRPIPSTPIVWTCFITGATAEPHEVKYKWKSKAISWLSVSVAQRNKTLFSLLRKLKIAKGLGSLGFERDTTFGLSYLQRKGIKTIFDEVKPSIGVSIPAYNEHFFGYASRIDYDKVLGDEEATKQTVSKLNDLFDEEKNLMIKKMSEVDWKLFMVHFDVPDQHAHLWYREQDIPKLEKFYFELDEFTRGIQEKVGNEAWFLVMSDHGTLYGGHTLYGFYSSNRALGLLMPEITDFKDLILGNFKEKTRDRERIRRHLKQLGYI